MPITRIAMMVKAGYQILATLILGYYLVKGTILRERYGVRHVEERGGSGRQAR